MYREQLIKDLENILSKTCDAYALCASESKKIDSAVYHLRCVAKSALKAVKSASI